MKKQILFLGLLSFVLMGFGCQKDMQSQEDSQEEDLMLNKEQRQEMKEMMIKEDDGKIDFSDSVIESMKQISQYELAGPLMDVTGGNATGVAQATYENGQYVLIATFRGLEEPPQDHFYEGWIVRKDPLNVLSTGVVEKINGVYTNMYVSETDLRDHVTYVLTLEPDDGNPAPDVHIVEGMLKKVSEISQ